MFPQFSRYLDYHQNQINRIIHVVTIPIIVFTFARVLSTIPGLLTIVLSSYSWHYFNIDREGYYAGLWLVFFGFPSYFYNQIITLQTAVVLNVVSWIIQICVGHWIFEKNQPAFFTGLVDSLITAPLFATIELFHITN